MTVIILASVWLVTLSLFDIRYRRVPIWLILLGGILSGGMLIYQWRIGESEIADCFFGMIPGIALLLLALSTHKAGWADGVVTMFLGSVLGFWQCVLAIMLSLILTSVVSLLLMIFRRVDKGTKIPFIPFLTLGFILGGIVGG